MLTLAQKVSIRRHLGTPFAGTAQAGRLYGWRFTWYREDLEYRMNNLQPPEEQLITGASLGSFKIDGVPEVGDTLTFGLTDGVNNLSTTYTVQASDFTLPNNPINPSQSSPLYSIALNVANQMRATGWSAALYDAVGVMPADLYSEAFLPPYFAEVEILGPSASTFTLSASAVGKTNVFVSAQGAPSPVQQVILNAVTGAQTTLYGWCALCDTLAMGMAQANLSLWLQNAGGAGGSKVTFRPDEVSARKKLYRTYCEQLEMALGGASYVRQFGGTHSGGAIA